MLVQDDENVAYILTQFPLQDHLCSQTRCPCISPATQQSSTVKDTQLWTGAKEVGLTNLEELSFLFVFAFPNAAKQSYSNIPSIIWTPGLKPPLSRW